MDTPSALALALTLLLALLSALAFVLLYLRSPWAASAAVARGNNKSHLHSHSHPGSHHGHSHSNNSSHSHSSSGSGGSAGGHGSASGGSNAGGHGSHVHHANSTASLGGKDASGGSVLHNAAVPGMLGGSGLSSAAANAAHLAALTSSPSSHSAHAAGHNASATALAASASALSAADLALRGRKVKNNKQRSGLGGAPGSSSNAASSTALPASSRGRISSSAGSSASSSSAYPLEFLSVAPPVIVCLTTLPSRVHHIDKCLSSIKSQSYPIHQILLVIPEESRREHTKYSIPDRVRKDAIITVVRVQKDYGPATRIIQAWASAGGVNPAVTTGPDSPGGHAHDLPSAASASAASAASSSAAALSCDTLLITLDDDLIYHPDTVATLVRHALAHPDSAVGFAGYSLRGRPYIQPNFEYSRRREERPDLSWKSVQIALQNQISYAAATAAANHATNSAALAAAAAAVAHSPAHHLSSSSLHVISPSLDPALLPCCDPLPDPPLDGEALYAHAHPNPNEVYESECVDVLCGWRGGLCVRRKFLDERIWTDFATLANPSSSGSASGCCPEAAMAADDEWLSAHLSRNGVPRRVILAPFELVLGRLRLRHGRNSTSASHLAYQQSVLECLVEEKRWMGSGSAAGNGVAGGLERGGRSYSLSSSSSSSRGFQSNSHSASSSPRTPFSDLSASSSDADPAAAAAASSAETDAAREAENLRRIAQLIQTIDVKHDAIDGE